MSKTIVLLAAGTRGDLQPCVALGLGLRAAGYRVRIVSASVFQRLVIERGLEFAPLAGNPSDLMTQPGGQAALTAGGSLRATLRFAREARPVYAQMMASAWDACQGADGVVAGLASIWGWHLAQALGVPCVWAFLQPFGRTRAFPSALLPVTGRANSVVNRLSYALVELAVWLPWRGVVNDWRRAHRLPGVGLSSPYRQISNNSDMVLYGFSPHIVAPPPDWPRSHHVTGYWFLDAIPGWQPSFELERFIDAGDAPVYIGFGSPGTPHPEKAGALILEALRQSNLRAVVDLPPGVLPLEADPRRVYLAKDTPHDWLFPRMAALAHHGGAGTTGYGLRAGVPAVIAPLGVDQFFWGQRLQTLGAGAQMLPQRQLSASVLAERLTRMVSDAEMRAKARTLGKALRQENGVAAAVEIIRKAMEG